MNNLLFTYFCIIIFCQVLLPNHWSEGLPQHEQRWISKSVFMPGNTGRPVLKKSLQLWWHPPPPPLVYNQPPASADLFFCRPFFLWLPYRMWKVKFKCSECDGGQLTGAGLYQNVRKVLDIDGYFYMATESVECSRCHRRFASWSEFILQQLDVGHRCQFPALLTYRLESLFT